MIINYFLEATIYCCFITFHTLQMCLYRELFIITIKFETGHLKIKEFWVLTDIYYILEIRRLTSITNFKNTQILIRYDLQF